MTRILTMTWRLCALLLLLPGCGEDADASAPTPDATPHKKEGDMGDKKEPTSKTPTTSEGSPLKDPVPPVAQAPPLKPELLLLTWVGGKGDQNLRAVAITGEGSQAVVVAEGKGFSVRYAVAGGKAEVQGDASTSDAEGFSGRPDLPGNPGRAYEDPRSGLDFRVGFRQASSLQVPIFRAFKGEERVWDLWGHAVDDIKAKKLGADSRCYGAWAMPGGRLGVQCWTDGGNSVLAKDPHDLNSGAMWTQGSYMSGAGGMASLYALVDPKDGGQVLSGTFIARHVSPLIADPWGRVIVADVAARRNAGDDITNPFDQHEEAGAGFFVLDSELRTPLLNVVLGGSCKDGKQGFGAIALQGGLLALAGTTCADDLAVVSPVQDEAGGGQDGFLAIVRLW